LATFSGEHGGKMSETLKQSYQALESKIEQRTKELVALSEVTSIIRQSQDTDTVMQQVAGKIREIFEIDNVWIFSSMANQDTLRLCALAQQNNASSESPPTFRAKGILAKVTEIGEPLIFEDIEDNRIYDDISQSTMSKKAEFRFFAAIPIKLKGRVFGVIACDNRTARRLSEHEFRLLTLVADQLGPVIENRNLFEEIKEKTTQLEISKREISDALVQKTAIAGTLRIMASSPSNLQAVFDTLLANAVILSCAAGGVIRLLDESGRLRFVAHFRHGKQLLIALQNTPPLLDENSATTRAMRERHAVQIRDIQNAGPDYRGPVKPDPWHTALGLPLLEEGAAVGALVVFRDVVEPFTDQQVELLATFADEAVVAIKTATLLQKLQQHTQQLEIANERLTQVDKLKTSFLSNVSHELKTPLTVIGSLVDNMLDGVTGALNAKQVRYIGGIKDSMERLTRLIHGLLDLSVIESGKIELIKTHLSISLLIREVVENFASMAKDKFISINLPSRLCGDQFVWADRDKINQVLTNLITNAIKFSPAGGVVKLMLKAMDGGHLLRVGVSDDGPGIKPAEAQLIFDEFYQINQPGQKKLAGVGLGLAICKKLIDMHGGQIWVESEFGRGSTFYFTLPAHRKMIKSGKTNRAHP
jgi:signal transduction histidine kinase